MSKKKKNNSFQLLFSSYCVKADTKLVGTLVLYLNIPQFILGMFTYFFKFENMREKSLGCAQKPELIQIKYYLVNSHHVLGGPPQNPFLHFLLGDNTAASKQNGFNI